MPYQLKLDNEKNRELLEKAISDCNRVYESMVHRELACIQAGKSREDIIEAKACSKKHELLLSLMLDLRKAPIIEPEKFKTFKETCHKYIAGLEEFFAAFTWVEQPKYQLVLTPENQKLRSEAIEILRNLRECAKKQLSMISSDMKKQETSTSFEAFLENQQKQVLSAWQFFVDLLGKLESLDEKTLIDADEFNALRSNVRKYSALKSLDKKLFAAFTVIKSEVRQGSGKENKKEDENKEQSKIINPICSWSRLSPPPRKFLPKQSQEPSVHKWTVLNQALKYFN